MSRFKIIYLVISMYLEGTIKKQREIEVSEKTSPIIQIVCGHYARLRHSKYDHERQFQFRL